MGKRQLKQVDKFAELREFNSIGDVVEGILTGTHNGNTKHGEALFLDFADEETGEKFTICAGAALVGYDWEGLKGKFVQITYESLEKNAKSGRQYKAFNVLSE